jgi:hypothetical protein
MKGCAVFILGLLTVLLAAVIILPATPFGRTILNKWNFAVQKADDWTRYETLKKVEDTCRAMRASYETDKLTYEQYRAGNAEQQGWASQALMRANKTAAVYNEYVLKNNFVWKDGVPPDIYAALPVLNPQQTNKENQHAGH